MLAIVASMNEGVIATDTRQRIVLVNQKAAELLEFSSDATRHGKSRCGNWCGNEPILRAAVERVPLPAAKKRIFQVSPSVGRYLEIAACTFPSPGQSLRGWFSSPTTRPNPYDIKKLRKRIRRQCFVMNSRTPLTVIRGFTETLRDGALNDPVAGPRFLSTIGKHVDQLQNLVSSTCSSFYRGLKVRPKCRGG